MSRGLLYLPFIVFALECSVCVSGNIVFQVERNNLTLGTYLLPGSLQFVLQNIWVQYFDR